ncbi:DUF378 domain-containing protein [Terrilactibacillus sp. BCM23-1]|uniref:DUF378 domain-containing protein n=1 Tax=Terrilactibacillus tamarindi TaxID=2599694 RepID=A0A6N8CL98_9BACI|nr:DUF378 domain-containing protein [Terrilactibacillus tamarindi]MTT30649.1 DUF378 domain-containing protein [Terrilactibacillus tamarindi]
MGGLQRFALALLIIGGINWGLIGFFNFDLVAAVFGGTLARIIYGVVGICALYCLTLLFKPSEQVEHSRETSTH